MRPGLREFDANPAPSLYEVAPRVADTTHFLGASRAAYSTYPVVSSCERPGARLLAHAHRDANDRSRAFDDLSPDCRPEVSESGPAGSARCRVAPHGPRSMERGAARRDALTAHVTPRPPLYEPDPRIEHDAVARWRPRDPRCRCKTHGHVDGGDRLQPRRHLPNAVCIPGATTAFVATQGMAQRTRGTARPRPLRHRRDKA